MYVYICICSLIIIRFPSKDLPFRGLEHFLVNAWLMTCMQWEAGGTLGTISAAGTLGPSSAGGTRGSRGMDPGHWPQQYELFKAKLS